MNFKKQNLLIMGILITLGIAGRLLVHLPNFTPLAAIAWFSAFYFARRSAYITILVTMILSDAVIGFYTGGVLVAVYGSFLLLAYLGHHLKNNINAWRVVGASLLGSTIFFLITNAAVWAFTPLYAKNFAGLWQSYIMGLPFYRNAMLGDLVYSSLLFGAAAVVALVIKKRVIWEKV